MSLSFKPGDRKICSTKLFIPKWSLMSQMWRSVKTAVWVTPSLFSCPPFLWLTFRQLGFEILCQSCSLKPAFPKSEVCYKYTLLPFTTLTVESHFNWRSPKKFLPKSGLQLLLIRDDCKRLNALNQQHNQSQWINQELKQKVSRSTALMASVLVTRQCEQRLTDFVLKS